ncbi:hypothetical protein AMJ50_01280 [Parcubacteria bacterium DG_74_3]|nr:MAG: hypothetical protein AMJ50_01280 [Parcubacteria bacterium DG_74_3]
MPNLESLDPQPQLKLIRWPSFYHICQKEKPETLFPPALFQNPRFSFLFFPLLYLFLNYLKSA